MDLKSYFLTLVGTQRAVDKRKVRTERPLSNQVERPSDRWAQRPLGSQITRCQRPLAPSGRWEIIGVTFEASPSSTVDSVDDMAINQSHYSRPWLAAEILCTSKWLGGNIFHSFLPSFLSYVKKGDYGFSDSILTILLDGALVHGAGSGLNLLWYASVDELEAVEEPFLRALASLLSTFFQENVWGNQKALSLFKLLLEKLYVGDTVNSNCLKILPSVVNILVGPLGSGYEDSANDQHDLYRQSEFHNVTVDWLKKAVSFPPLNTWKIIHGRL
ncbi:hypothetical protein C2S52_009310 [Perilla frutescens var. hirtella]|nr:hypothetical protein C2S52_009310 [Perilla frutescens var. hirtella]